jgi:hypothetical protein
MAVYPKSLHRLSSKATATTLTSCNPTIKLVHLISLNPPCELRALLQCSGPDVVCAVRRYPVTTKSFVDMAGLATVGKGSAGGKGVSPGRNRPWISGARSPKRA